MPPKTNEELAREIVNICDEDDSGSVYQKITTLLNAKDKEKEEAVKGLSYWIDHKIECIKQFEEDAECDCGLIKALTPPDTH
jgi:hypothetical protein